MHVAGRERPPAGKPHGEVGVTLGRDRDLSFNRRNTMRGESFNELIAAKEFAEQVGISDQYREQRPFNHTPVTQEQVDEHS